jgi:hypothetical protein
VFAVFPNENEVDGIAAKSILELEEGKLAFVVVEISAPISATPLSFEQLNRIYKFHIINY